MFIIRFFTGSVFGIVTGVLLTLVVLVVLLAGMTLALAATGGPDACTPGGGPIIIDDANSAAFQEKWDALTETLDGGGSASTSFSESEISSRAQSYLDKHDAPIHDVRACVHDGYGEGTGTLSFLGLDVKFRVKGTMDLSGAHPDAQIDDYEIGNVPGFVTGALDMILSQAIDDQLGSIDLRHRYAPTLSEGTADIAGEP